MDCLTEIAADMHVPPIPKRLSLILKMDKHTSLQGRSEIDGLNPGSTTLVF